jgi:hypothetical protein
VDVLSEAPIVTDPKDSNDSIPEVQVQVSYTTKKGCTYTDAGSKYVRAAPKRFRVVVKESSAVC